MKKMLILAVVLLLAVPVFAGENREGQARELGAKFDAPNLIRLTDNLTIGAEAFKDTYYTRAEEGWGGFIKLTFSPTLLDFSKK